MEWRCDCGESFEEDGSGVGTKQMMSHYNKTRHKILGLFEGEEKLLGGRSIAAAQKRGYIPKKQKAKSPMSPDIQFLSPAKAVIKPIVVELSPTLLVLYEVARARFPEEYGEAPLEQWVEECVMGFYRDHADELGLSALLKLRPEFAATKE